MLEESPNEVPRTLLITLTGKDRPGVTSLVFETLASFGVEVLDIEQIVLRRRLVLGLLVRAPRNWKSLRDALHDVAAQLGMSVEVDRGSGDNPPRPEGRSHVTVLGTPLKSAAVAAITGRVADTGANIDRIERMARYPVTAIDLHVSGADPESFREILTREAAHQGVDIAVQAAKLTRRSKRLIVMDVDSTLIQGEVIESCRACRSGRRSRRSRSVRCTAKHRLRGEPARAGRLLEGLDPSALAEVFAEVELAPGARSDRSRAQAAGIPHRHLGRVLEVIDRPIEEALGIDFAVANGFEIVDGELTGAVLGDVIDWASTRPSCSTSIARGSAWLDQRRSPSATAPTTSTCSTRAGLGIAFNAKPMVQEPAHAAVNVPYMDAVLYLLGIRREEIVAADAEAGFTTPEPSV